MEKDFFTLKYGSVGGQEYTTTLHATLAEANAQALALTDEVHEYCHVFAANENGYEYEVNYIWHEH